MRISAFRLSCVLTFSLLHCGMREAAGLCREVWCGYIFCFWGIYERERAVFRLHSENSSSIDKYDFTFSAWKDSLLVRQSCFQRQPVSCVPCPPRRREH